MLNIEAQSLSHHLSCTLKKISCHCLLSLNCYKIYVEIAKYCNSWTFAQCVKKTITTINIAWWTWVQFCKHVPKQLKPLLNFVYLTFSRKTKNYKWTLFIQSYFQYIDIHILNFEINLMNKMYTFILIKTILITICIL